MNFKFSGAKYYIQSIQILLIFIIVILLVSVYVSTRVINSGNAIADSQSVLEYSTKIQTLAFDNESGFRAYILTGRKTLLEPQERLQKEIYNKLTILKTITRRNQLQKLRIDSLYFYVEERIAFSNKTIANYESTGAEVAMKIAETGEGKLYAERVRLLVAGLQDTENILLTQYKETNNKSVRNLQRVLFFIIAGIVLLLIVFYRKTSADNIEKEKAAAALNKINDELEQRVKERTEELSIKEKLFKALVENNEGIICLIDEKLKVLFRSSSTTLITGWLIKEQAKVAMGEYIHPGDMPTVKDVINELFEQPGKAIPVSLRFRHQQGHYIFLEGVVKNMIHDQAIGGIIINLRDITQRIEAELKVRSAIERYDILTEATSDTIWDWDIVKNTMLYNDGISKMFGYERAQVENLVDWWNEKLHPNDVIKLTELLEDVFSNGLEKFQLKYRFRCADGTYKYIFDRAYVIFDENSNPCRMIGAMQDITYEVEEGIRTSKAIIDAQEQERRFIGGELHDNVNQILASSLLAFSMVKKNPRISKATFKFIEMGKEHILHAIEEVRKLSHNLAPASFDKNSLENAIKNLLANFNVNKQFNIKLSFDEKCNDVNDDIQINLYRILQEQIKNIVKYSGADEIEIAVKWSGDTVKMRIFDNGIGFNVKTVKNGIGLNNIRKRAESFSGKFTLNSAKGKGSELLLELPIANGCARE